MAALRRRPWLRAVMAVGSAHSAGAVPVEWLPAMLSSPSGCTYKIPSTVGPGPGVIYARLILSPKSNLRWPDGLGMMRLSRLKQAIVGTRIEAMRVGTPPVSTGRAGNTAAGRLDDVEWPACVPVRRAERIFNPACVEEHLSPS